MNKSLVLLLLVSVLLFNGCVGENAPKVQTTSTTSMTTTTTSTTATLTVSTTLAHPAATSTSTTSTSSTTTSTTLLKVAEPPKVEVVFFYPSYSCASCERVGAMLDKVIYSDYSNELASGQIVYKVENLGNPNDKADIIKYGATSPSLWIGTTVNGTFYKEIKSGVWFKSQDEDAFREYLDGYLDKRLRGDISN